MIHQRQVHHEKVDDETIIRKMLKQSRKKIL